MDLLDSGQAYVRKWWVNNNSSKNQCGVQFVQKVSKPVEGASLLVALAQGNENADSTVPTTVMSFNKDVIVKHLGSEEGNFIDENGKLTGTPMTAKALFSAVLGKDIPEVNIQIEENFDYPIDAEGNQIFTKDENGNEVAMGLKSNPTTGEAVRAFDTNGELKEVYRHTTLVAGPANNTFVRTASKAEIMRAEAIEETAEAVLDTHGV